MNTYDVNNDNKLKCNIDNTENYTGILNCSKYNSENEIFHYSLEYLNGKPIELNSKIYEFNNLEFANAIYKKSSNYENIKNCFIVDNYDTCGGKQLYGSAKIDNLNDVNYINYCKNNNICTNKYNYKDSYILNKKCFGNDCSYNINCECYKI